MRNFAWILFVSRNFYVQRERESEYARDGGREIQFSSLMTSPILTSLRIFHANESFLVQKFELLIE